MLLRLVVACDEQTLGQCVVARIIGAPSMLSGAAVRTFRQDDFSGGCIPDTVTVLHQFAWDGDVDAVAMFLALPQCTTRLVNATAGHAHQRITTGRPPGSPGGTAELTDEMGRSGDAAARCLSRRSHICSSIVIARRSRRSELSQFCMMGNVCRILTTIAMDADSVTLFMDRWQNHHVAECVRALTRDPRTKVDVWYTKTGNEYDGASVQCHISTDCEVRSLLEHTYHVLAALPKLDPHSVKMNDPLRQLGLDALSPIEQCLAWPCSPLSDTASIRCSAS